MEFKIREVTDPNTGEVFTWVIVDNIAKKLFRNTEVEMYVIHDDHSESLVETEQDILEALNNHLNIGVDLTEDIKQHIENGD